MPKVTSFPISVRSAGARHRVDFDFFVNAQGKFYCNIPELLEPYFVYGWKQGNVSCDRRNRKAAPQLFAPTLEELKSALEEAVRVCHAPEVKEEKLILYNIESHVSFWETESGEILPNGYAAGDKGGKWAGSGRNPSKRYGDHHATNPARGGYSLILGAIAVVQKTETFGSQSKVSHERYYGHQAGSNADTPAARLNSWCGFELPKDPKSMPYSDEAAEFFYDMMAGMARLSQMIQDRTHDPQDLLLAIKNSQNPLIGKN